MSSIISHVSQWSKEITVSRIMNSVALVTGIVGTLAMINECMIARDNNSNLPPWYDVLYTYYTFDKKHTEKIDKLAHECSKNRFIDEEGKVIPAEGTHYYQFKDSANILHKINLIKQSIKDSNGINTITIYRAKALKLTTLEKFYDHFKQQSVVQNEILSQPPPSMVCQEVDPQSPRQMITEPAQSDSNLMAIYRYMFPGTV